MRLPLSSKAPLKSSIKPGRLPTRRRKKRPLKNHCSRRRQKLRKNNRNESYISIFNSFILEFRISNFELLAMANMRDIRRRIRSVGNTAKITKAMQMVAASKMRKAQQAAINFRPFAALLYRVQRQATTQATDFTHPLLEVREVRKRAIILVGGDKGLC